MTCYLRFLNAAISETPFDVYINDFIVAKNFDYRDFTEYFTGKSGVYNIKVYPAGKKSDIILDQNIELVSDVIYTIAIIGVLPYNTLELQLIRDYKHILSENKSYIRFVNLSPGFPALDVALNDKLAVEALDYTNVSEYLTLEPSNYNLKAYNSKNGALEMENPNMLLKAGKAYTGYFVGLVDELFPLQILIPLEGTTYLK